MSSLDYLDLCRLCLVKDRVSVPIFEGEGNVRQIFLKIAACLPVKVAREDKLPKKICDDCVYKVELFYQFWNTTVNAEKQLLQWLGEVNLEDKQGYIANVLTPGVMKQEQSTENRLDGNVMQQVGEHQNNMGMGMMENMGLGIPMMISSANQQQQITSVPMDTGNNPVQTVQAVPGPSTQTTHNQISQNQTSSTQQEDEEESSEDDDNSDDECDPDDGLPVKEESEEDPNNRTIEPTTFVNVSLACDEAGPSGLQQQKIADIPEMPMPQPTDGDPKSGSPQVDPLKGSEPNSLDGPYPIRIESSYSLNRRERKREREKLRRMKLKDLACQETGNKLEETISTIEVFKGGFVCDYCGECFNRKAFLAAHMQIHRYRCKSCGSTFKYRKDLSQHTVQVHGPVLHPCNICDYKTVYRWALKDHFRRKHSNTFEYSCTICGKEFKVKHDLLQHTQTHKNGPPVICTVCGHVAKHVSTLKSHMKHKHSKLGFECNLCKRRMSTQKNLELHLTWHKTSEKMVCPTCGKRFRGRDLNSHMRVHTGVKPFLCPVCGKSFRRQSAQEQHLLIHTGKKPYVCDICGQAFAQKPGLICHRKRHPGPLPPLPAVSIKNILKEFAREYSMKNTLVENE